MRAAAAAETLGTVLFPGPGTSVAGRESGLHAVVRAGVRCLRGQRGAGLRLGIPNHGGAARAPLKLGEEGLPAPPPSG